MVLGSIVSILAFQAPGRPLCTHLYCPICKVVAVAFAPAESGGTEMRSFIKLNTVDS